MITAHALVLLGTLISPVCLAVSVLRHGSATLEQLKHDAREAVMIVTPHKTASSFLSKVFHEIAHELQVCHITEDNCLTLKDQASCKGAVVGTIHAKNGSWGSLCGPELLKSFNNDSQTTGMEFNNTPYIYAMRNWSNMPDPHKQHKVLKILHHRHPLDILCSEYKSFGWNHKKPPNKSDKDFKAFQNNIRNMTVDEYALVHVYRQIRYIKEACQIVQDFNRQKDDLAIFSSYENMVTDFPAWLSNIVEVMMPKSTKRERVSFVSRVINQIKPDFGNDGQHKTHTQPNRYLEELKPETIESLTQLIRNHTSNACLCWTMNYHDICATRSGMRNRKNDTSHWPVGSQPLSIDPMIAAWGVTDN